MIKSKGIRTYAFHIFDLLHKPVYQENVFLEQKKK